ncbi:MAG: hypothetical protein DRQ88_12130 [Epsilonproteobacteria bacterium]|nr:MAG: hypothetical protein DRQ88_12130 [Campylobacterota bacterium]RLA64705.1 MAG: hypothetical protein DRQ89_03320 [Campylobacterota bacterium]
MIRFSVILLALFISFSPKLFSSEGSTYSFDWLDPDKEVYVLQNRKFRKEGHLYANVGAGYTFSEPFWNGPNLSLRGGYFFWEEWGVEALYSYVGSSENANATAVRGLPSQGIGGSIPFTRMTKSYGGLQVLWSPFYSKVNLFNGVVYSDWMIGLGIVSIQEENNQENFDINILNPQLTAENHVGLTLDLAWQFYIWTKWHLRLDITSIHYFASGLDQENSTNEYNGTWDAQFSMGYRF